MKNNSNELFEEIKFCQCQRSNLHFRTNLEKSKYKELKLILS